MEYTAKDLIRMGYRRTSSRYQIISRIDRYDWIDVVYDKAFGHREPFIKEAVKSYYNGMSLDDFGFTKNIIEHEAGSVADQYRRSFSLDKIQGVPIHIFKQIPGSNWDITGYCKGKSFKKGDTFSELKE